MLYREIIAVCSQIHTKHITTLCGQNVELLSVKPGGTYSYHWALQRVNSSAALHYIFSTAMATLCSHKYRHVALQERSVASTTVETLTCDKLTVN